MIQKGKMKFRVLVAFILLFEGVQSQDLFIHSTSEVGFTRFSQDIYVSRDSGFYFYNRRDEHAKNFPGCLHKKLESSEVKSLEIQIDSLLRMRQPKDHDPFCESSYLMTIVFHGKRRVISESCKQEQTDAKREFQKRAQAIHQSLMGLLDEGEKCKPGWYLILEPAEHSDSQTNPCTLTGNLIGIRLPKSISNYEYPIFLGSADQSETKGNFAKLAGKCYEATFRRF